LSSRSRGRKQGAVLPNRVLGATAPTHLGVNVSIVKPVSSMMSSMSGIVVQISEEFLYRVSTKSCCIVSPGRSVTRSTGYAATRNEAPNETVGTARQYIKLKKVNFEIYIADRKATTCISSKLFLLRCVNPAALPLVRCFSIRLSRRVARLSELQQSTN